VRWRRAGAGRHAEPLADRWSMREPEPRRAYGARQSLREKISAAIAPPEPEAIDTDRMQTEAFWREVWR